MHLPKLTIIEPQRREPRPPDGIIEHRFRVGRYTVRMVMDLDGMGPGVHGQTNVLWEPGMPAPGTLTAADYRQYVRGRNAMQQRVANIIGGNVLVADL